MRQLLLPFCISIFCCLFVACKSSFNPNGLYILADEAYTTNYFDYNYLATLSSLSDTAEHFVMDCSLIAGVRKRKIYFSFSNSTKKYYLNDTIRISNASYKIVGLVRHENGGNAWNFFTYGNPEVNFSTLNGAITPASDDSLYQKARSHFDSKLAEDNKIYLEHMKHLPYPIRSAGLHYSSHDRVDVILAKEKEAKK